MIPVIPIMPKVSMYNVCDDMCDMVWCGMARGVVWCSMWCGMMWYVVWCGVCFSVVCNVMWCIW